MSKLSHGKKQLYVAYIQSGILFTLWVALYTAPALSALFFPESSDGLIEFSSSIGGVITLIVFTFGLLFWYEILQTKINHAQRMMEKESRPIFYFK